jgi:hypothetical protein
MEFEGKLRALLAEYGYSLRDVTALLYLQSVARNARTTSQDEKTSRKPRKVKRHKNPHTGEVVETKGGTHKILKAWKAEVGGEQVESWVQ